MRNVKRYLPVILVGAGFLLGGCAWLFRPLEAKLSANHISGPAPLPVTFSAAGSTGPIVSFTLDFGDDSYPYSGTDLTVAIPHTYADPGTYTAVLTVFDAQGRTATDSVTITVEPGTTASLGAMPPHVSAGEEVLFLVHATAASGRKIVNWKLEFGDGDYLEFPANTTILNLPISHVYEEPEIYLAKLTVWDNAGVTATAEVEVEVTTPPPTIDEFTATQGHDLTVEFYFEAEAGSGAKLTKWTLFFGDGAFTGAEGLNVTPLTHMVTHEYTQTGSYTAILKIWDNLNQMSEETVEIEVEEP